MSAVLFSIIFIAYLLLITRAIATSFEMSTLSKIIIIASVLGFMICVVLLPLYAALNGTGWAILILVFLLLTAVNSFLFYRAEDCLIFDSICTGMTVSLFVSLLLLAAAFLVAHIIGTPFFHILCK